jgi:hypothetical protein
VAQVKLRATPIAMSERIRCSLHCAATTTSLA